MRIVFATCALISLTLSLSSCATEAPLDPPAPPTEWSPPTQVKTQDGVRVSLDGRFRSSIVGRRNPDGTISSDCYDDSPIDGAARRVAGLTTMAQTPTATRAEAQ